MEAIGAYLLGVTAAALLCAVVSKLGAGHLTGSVMKVLCGLFMALAVVAPWAELQLKLPSDVLSDFQILGEDLAAQGEKTARDTMAAIITEQTAAYILDKAGALGLELDVEVMISDDEIPVPLGVTLRGAVSPYHKGVLEDHIQNNLGIDKEALIWIS